MSAPLLEQLIDALRVLPGVGQKTAQRMAYHLLEREREGGQRLAETLELAVERIGHCVQCRDFSETELCPTCANGSRERSQLCVVESPADRLAIENATGFRGVYFVLQGRLSPLDGVRSSAHCASIPNNRTTRASPARALVHQRKRPYLPRQCPRSARAQPDR
nr:toprim domain-containing protein [Bradyrhizobium sp. WBOS07]